MAGTQVDPASKSPVNLALHAALLDFHASPGKYHVGLRQPEALFSSIREILNIAFGRTADEDLRRAAGFFTRSVLLHPGSDHYALLGLDRSADAAAIKDRYRQMMRLLHPDFTAAEPGVWPATAPARVNLAYEVLSSPLQRRDYDASLAGTSRPSPGVARRFPVPMTHSPRRVRGPARRGDRKGLRTVVVICGVTGFALVLGTLLVGGRDVVHLVRRAPSNPPQAVAPQAEPVAPSEPPTVPVVMHETPFSAPTVPAVQVPRPTAMVPPPPPPEPVITPPVVAAPVQPAPAIAAPAPIPAVVTPAPPPPAPLAAPPPRQVAGVTLAEAQPLLATLLQLVQGGSGERLLNLLDRDARNVPAAQALSRQLDALAEGSRPMKLTQVHFRAEPADGRLYVIGHMQLHADGAAEAPVKNLSLRVEFASRGGTVVMTGLTSLGGN